MVDNKAFYKLSYGMYIISSFSGDKINGQIANTVFQITSDPQMVAVSINKENLTHEYIQKGKRIGISVLCEDTPMDFIGKFGFKSGRDIDKFSGVSYKMLESGLPIVLENSVSYFELELEKEVDVLTHTIFIGRVVSAEVINDADQMTYKYYQNVKHGKSPKGAPTYLEGAPEATTKKDIKKYKCSICGYIYDPSLGDTDSGISANTLFEDVPNDWVCPICGASKEEFDLI